MDVMDVVKDVPAARHERLHVPAHIRRHFMRCAPRKNVLRINPAAAKKYGIGNGDWVKVESPHGWSKFKAEYFEGIAPDVLMTKRG